MLHKTLWKRALIASIVLFTFLLPLFPGSAQATFGGGNKTVKVSGLTVSPSSLSLKVGEEGQLTATIKPANASNKNVSWSSSNTKIATVKNGKVQGISPGKAVITAVTEDGKHKASSSVTVSDPTVKVKSITLTPKLVTLTVGEQQGLTAVIRPADATNKEVSWFSLNPRAASVENGIVKALSPGVSIVKVFTKDGNHYDWSLITVCAPKQVPVKGIKVSPKRLDLIAGGETGQLTAQITPANATDSKVAWTSSNPEVATVDQNGKVYPLAPGKTTVTAAAGKKYSDSAEVYVTKPEIAPGGITISPKELNLEVGGADGQLTAQVLPENATNKTVIWTSSDPSIASVENGTVRPVSAGTVTIAASTADGKYSDTATVHVTVPALSLTLTPETLDLTVGGPEGILTATILPENASNKKIIWSSSNPEVAEVVDGIVLPVSPGTAVITAATESGGLSATSLVTVTDPDTVPPVTKKMFTPVPYEDNTGIKGLIAELTATDDKSGVKDTFYRINGGQWIKYTAPFTLWAQTDYLLEYYSTDNAGNQERINKYDFRTGNCDCSK